MSPRQWLAGRDWVKAVERIGLAATLCLIVMGGGGLGLRWLATEIFKPIIDESIETSRELRKQLPIQTATTKTIAETQAKLVQTQEQALKNHELILKSEAKQNETLEAIRVFGTDVKRDHASQSDRMKTIEEKQDCEIKVLKSIDGRLPPPG